MKFTVSLVQLNAQDSLSKSRAEVEKYIRESAAAHANLICLPENAFFMKNKNQKGYPDMSAEVDHCAKLAKELRVWILIGSLQVPATEGKYCNRSLLIDDEGDVVAQYDKIHLFDVVLKNEEAYLESALIDAGKEAVLAATPWGKLGMTVCYDLRFAHLYRVLAMEGADFLTVPAAFTYTTGKAHWHTLLRARAIETGCYVFAPGQCGMHPGNRQTYGHSLVIAPWGEIVAEASEDTPGITLAEIDTAKVAEVRQMIPALQHDRDFVVKQHG